MRRGTGIVSGSSAHRRFQEWTLAGVFHALWALSLEDYDEVKGIDWTWLALDGAMTKAPLGERGSGPNPTDRAKRGVKRSVLTDGAGIPLGVAVAGAHVVDFKLAEETLESIPIERPQPSPTQPQGLCLDKGYDSVELFLLLILHGFTPHVRTRGEEITDKHTIPDYHPRRWVVERTHAWINRFRRLLIRWEKKTANYKALLHLAFACLTFQKAALLG